MHLSRVINCWGDPIDLCSSLSYCVVSSLPEVPGEAGSSPPVTACGPIPVSFLPGLFAVSVLPSACHTCPCHTCPCNGDVCCTAPVCRSIFRVSLDCSVQVLLAPFMCLHGPFSKGPTLCLPLRDFQVLTTLLHPEEPPTMSLVSFRCCTAQRTDCPLWCLQNTRQTYGSITERGIIIISISHYHNETQGRKQTAAHGTKPARCSQFLYYQF